MKSRILSLFFALCLIAVIVPQTVCALTDTESNNVFTDAQSFALGDSITGSISEKTDVDVYTFTIAESGRVQFVIKAEMQYYSLQLYNPAGDELYCSDYNEWNSTVGYREDTHNLDLKAGTYYIRITGQAHPDNNYSTKTTGSYSIKTAFTGAGANETEPNNSVAEANALTLPATVNGQIAINDGHDFFKIQLAKSGRLTLDMSSYMRFFALQVFNASGAKLWYDDYNEWNTTVGYLNDSFHMDLEAGTYYIKVTGQKDHDYNYTDKATGNYTLKVSFTDAQVTETEENDSLAEANALALNSQVKGQIAINDGHDFFKIQLPKSGRVGLDMTSYMQFYALQVFNESGTQLWYDDYNEWNSTVGYLSQSANLDLEAGNYYIKVTGCEDHDYSYTDKATGNYTLKVSFTDAQGTEAEENDQLEHANALALGSEVKGQIAINDSTDFFKIQLTEAGRVSLDMTAYMKYYALQLYNESGAQLWYDDYNEWNTTVGYQSYIHNVDLEIGTYYLKVTGREDHDYSYSDTATGNYTLKTGFTSAQVTEVEDNDRPEDANELSLKGSVKGQIALNDPFDFYKITMAANDELKINVTVWMKHYSIFLLNESGEQVWSNEWNTWNETTGFMAEEHTVELAAGTYLIKFTGYQYGSSNGSTGTYMLLLNHTHTWDGGVVTKLPSGSRPGEKTFTCTVCSATRVTEYTPANVTRVFGANRYQTSFALADVYKAEKGVSKFSCIIVASGTDFADALSGSYLASVKNAPILLLRNRKQEINEIKAYIKANLRSGGTVYLLGGKNAVPASMETGLEGFRVKRLAGATRYETNLAILKEAGVGSKDILICTGKGFADSLSASATGKPILLVKDSLSTAQKEFLQSTTGKKIILGGTSAVSSRVEKQLAAYGAVDRIGGNTRYETSVMIAEAFFDEPKAVVLAYAQNFPDGLCGGPLAYTLKAPMILTANGKQGVAAEYVKLQPIAKAYVLGGTSLISDKTVRNVFGLSSSDIISVWAD